MKKTKLFLAITICTIFTYVMIEQQTNINPVFKNNQTYTSAPIKPGPDPRMPQLTVVTDYNEFNNTDAENYGISEAPGKNTNQFDEPLLIQNGVESGEQIINMRDDTVQIIVTAVGDCILGYDAAYGFTGSFMDEYEKQNKDFSYFINNFKELFDNSDLTIANLEVPLTNSTEKADKEFVFKGLPEFTEILKLGNIDAVTLANNHTKDYLLEGYYDTVKNLENASIQYFGNEYTAITEIKGIKIGMLGYSAWYIDNGIKNNIIKGISRLREMGANLVIAYFHWGDERAPLPNEIQTTYAHFTIDNGADLVLGSHPHVIQGIEEYKGKQIVYSFGNFCYGGAKNPADKDTFVFQQMFTFSGHELLPDSNIKIIPASISSVKNRNNFQPAPLFGDEYERVANKIIERSVSFNSADTLRQALDFNGFEPN